MRFAVVDVETSGLRVDRDRVLQIALVIVEIDPAGDDRPAAAIIDRWSTYVRLRWPWQRVGPRAVHGIRRRDLWGAPSLDEALGEFARRSRGAWFTAHNAAFDAGFLERAARRHGIDWSAGSMVCTLKMSRRLDPERQLSHRLGDLCRRLGVPLDRPHDALEDALATAAVLPHLLAAHSVSSPDQLEAFCVSPVASLRS